MADADGGSSILSQFRSLYLGWFSLLNLFLCANSSLNVWNHAICEQCTVYCVTLSWLYSVYTTTEQLPAKASLKQLYTPTLINTRALVSTGILGNIALQIVLSNVQEFFSWKSFRKIILVKIKGFTCLMPNTSLHVDWSCVCTILIWFSFLHFPLLVNWQSAQTAQFLSLQRQD